MLHGYATTGRASVVVVAVFVASCFAPHGLAQEPPVQEKDAQGTLRILSTAGAEVTVDGKEVGVCGADGKLSHELATGEHAVKVTVFGYKPFEEKAEVYEDDCTEIEVDKDLLDAKTWISEEGDPASEHTKRTWGLVVRTVPDACTIDCFGLGWEKLAKTKSQWFARGVHTDRFSIEFAAGDGSVYHDFRPVVGKTTHLTVYVAEDRVEVDKGDLRVDGPTGIRLEIDGQERELVDGCVRDLPKGTHRLDISLPGFRSIREQIEVSAGREKVFACPALLPHLDVLADGAEAPKTRDSATLREDRGAMILRTDPAGTRVVCERIGLDATTATPGCKVLGIPPGKYEIQFFAKGSRVDHTVEIQPGGRVRLSVDVAAARVETMPPTAEDLVPVGGLPSDHGSAFSVAFSPDGRLAAGTVRMGNQASCALLWTVATGALFDQIPIDSRAERVCFSPDGKLLYVMHRSDRVSVVDWRRGRVVRVLDTGEGLNTTCAVAPSGLLWTMTCNSTGSRACIRAFGSGGAERRVDWNLEKGDPRLRVLGRPHGLCPDPRGGRVVLWGGEKALLVLDEDDGRVVRQLLRHKESVQAAAFSTDGSRLASSDHDGVIKIWDTTKWSVVRTISPRLLEARAAGRRPGPAHSGHQYTDLAWSPDGRFLGVGGSFSVLILDVTAGTVARELACRELGKVFTLEFSGDGRTLIAGGGGKALCMWKVR